MGDGQVDHCGAQCFGQGSGLHRVGVFQHHRQFFAAETKGLSARLLCGLLDGYAKLSQTGTALLMAIEVLTLYVIAEPQ